MMNLTQKVAFLMIRSSLTETPESVLLLHVVPCFRVSFPDHCLSTT